jgi:NADPH:quinone reductase-like Zn-dependent oxidoreductase
VHTVNLKISIRSPSLAGYEVITTSSQRNFDCVKKLGISQVFDYNSKSVVKDVIEALMGKTIAGALAIRSGQLMPVSALSTRATRSTGVYVDFCPRALAGRSICGPRRSRVLSERISTELYTQLGGNGG